MTWQIEVHAGRGPVEVCRFVVLLAERLSELATQAGADVKSQSYGFRHGGARRVRLALRGLSELPQALAAEEGTHLLVDPSRGSGRRKRWFVGVAFWQDGPPSGDGKPHRMRRQLDPSEVRVTRCRAGGPGGQHVNTSDSAVQVLHRPTGISVRVQGERSQHQNKARALAILAERVWVEQLEEVEERATEAQHAAHHMQRGQPVRTYRLEGRRLRLVASSSGEAETAASVPRSRPSQNRHGKKGRKR